MSTFASSTELRKHSVAELEKESKDLLRQAAHMRIGVGLQKEKNHAAYRRIRRQIARIQTALTESRKGLHKEKSGTTMAVSRNKKSAKSVVTTKNATKKSPHSSHSS